MIRLGSYDTDVLFDIDIAFERCLSYTDNIFSLDFICKKGITIVVFDDNIPLGILTAVKLWDGVYNVQLVPDKSAIDSKKISLLRGLKLCLRDLEKYVKLYGMKRLQTTTPDLVFYKKYMRFLGFEPEGVLRQFGPDGKTHIMWSRIWKI
jgi:hypothetical protein